MSAVFTATCRRVCIHRSKSIGFGTRAKTIVSRHTSPIERGFSSSAKVDHRGDALRATRAVITPTPAAADDNDACGYLEKIVAVEKSRKKRPIALKGVKGNNSTKRFYESVGVLEVENGWAITLADRTMATPLDNLVVVPTRSLALALALEWDNQIETIRAHSMPLMHLTTLALDHVSINKEAMIDQMMNYLNSDSACLRDFEDPSFSRLQSKHLDPVVEWMKEHHDVHMEVTSEEATAIGIVKQNAETHEKIRSILMSRNEYELAAMDSMTAVSKSISISLAILDGQLDVKKGYEASRLEENFQMRRYGRVDGYFGHGIDIEYTRMKISATRTLMNLLNAP